MQVKASLGIGLEQKGPSQPTLSCHRQRMQELELAETFNIRMQQLLLATELIGRSEPVLVDSVPIDGAGQQLDSYNLLAGAVRNGLRALAKVQERPVDEIAVEMGLAVSLGRSIKGRFDVDWSDESSRNAFLAQLLTDACRLRDLLVQNETNECRDESETDGTNVSVASLEPERMAENPLAEARETIEKVIAHDVDFDENGNVVGIRQKRAGDRIISLTDPDMRHGRKNASSWLAWFGQVTEDGSPRMSSTTTSNGKRSLALTG